MTQRTPSPSLVETLRVRLLEQQRRLFHEIDEAERDLRLIEESHAPELEEQAQQEALARLVDRLEERERRELEVIHHALGKIAAGIYGTCESCGREIAPDRLEADPSALHCLACELAEEEEVRGRTGGRSARTPSKRDLPPELRDLDDAEIAQVVRERIAEQGDPDLERVHVRSRDGVIRLSGGIPSEAQRQVLLQVVEDGLGLEVRDGLRVVPFDREDTGEERREETSETDEERIPQGAGMRPLRPKRPDPPLDEGEPEPDPPSGPVPETEK